MCTDIDLASLSLKCYILQLYERKMSLCSGNDKAELEDLCAFGIFAY